MSDAKKKGEAFLAGNAKKAGVVVLPSGLQYKVVAEGQGPKPTRKSAVTVHYKGTFIDGREFDSSYARNEPATFGVTQVIAGWTEALQLMSVGAKWEIALPSNLAYGPRGAGDDIGPDETLLFTVELLAIRG
jgi:FKBP-type peptidyl-prolyl cis-trans isomerase FklB